MCKENNFEKVVKMLNELRNKRGEMVFLGGNYEKDGVVFNALKRAVEEVGFIPIIAKEVFKEVDPSKIHSESLRLLHNCGFAVIDITNPAGQLMELERARDYGVITFVSYSSKHPSKVPVTLSKVMENWRLGYLFSYEDIEGLKKFVKSILLINHSKMSFEEILKAIVGEKKPKRLFLITSIGVLNTKEKIEEIKGLLKKFDKKVIITGWDFKTKGKKEAQKHEVDLIVCEGCVLYSKSNNEFHKTEDFCDEGSLRLVKMANRFVIHAINDYCKERNLREVVFYSQANEKSICYYLNPPKDIRKSLEELKERENITVDKFEKKVEQKCGMTSKFKSNNKIGYVRPKDAQAEESLLYAIEKVNAIYRTFLPYSIIIEKEEIIIVDLNPTANYKDYKEFTYRDIENIVEKAFTKKEMKDMYDQLHAKVLPQKDICIDILCKSKDDVLIPLLQKIVESRENSLIIYFSKGTESDIPMIFKGYSSGYNFIAIGGDDISDRLKRGGVIPLGKSAIVVMSKILEIVN